VSQVEHHQSGIRYWRGLEQLAETPEVHELLANEFPAYDPSGMLSNPSRRRFLKLMGASMALAGLTLTGCRRWPKEKLAPYSANPEGHVPGALESYATNWELGGVSQGLLVTSFDGRPIKVEGNPSHPFAWTIKDKQGASDAYAQASVLEMYDPARSREVVDRSSGARKASEWGTFEAFAGTHFGQMKGAGEGFAILSEATSSPSAVDMKGRLLKTYPKAKWYEYEALTRDNEVEGARQAFAGKALRSRLDLTKADVVLSLDADLLGTHPAHVRYAADWSERRRGGDQGKMNRVYCAESRFSITGSVADNRLPATPERIGVVARAIAAGLGVAGATAPEGLNEKEKKFIELAVRDLNAAKAAAVVAVGEALPPALHALGHAINDKLGAVGKAVALLDDGTGDRPTHLAAITELAQNMAAGKVGTLLIVGGNPAYDAPFDLNFADALKKVHVSIRLGLYEDETSVSCRWHLPRAHYLESWGDGRGWDGTAGIQQPLIEPLFGGRSAIEVMALLVGDGVRAGDQIVRRTWREKFIKGGDFDKSFRRALEAGVLDGTAYAAAAQAQVAALNAAPAQAAAAAGTYVLRFDADSHAYDGRFANNGWLQETHDPLTKLVWDNAALVSVQDAKREGWTTGDVIELAANGMRLEVPAYVLPGQPVGVIGLSLGYGRTEEKKGDLPVGAKLGFNGYAIRKSDGPYVVAGVKATKTGKEYVLAATHLHHLIDEVGYAGREDRVGHKGETGVVVREATLEEFVKDPRSPHERSEGAVRLQLFDAMADNKYTGPHAWGMAIDMNTCIGCNACVVACQAENNIPIVGKDQVLKHRAMHWIRIDRYFKTNVAKATGEEHGKVDPWEEAADPQLDVVHQPMLCVHCENAPCEQVCPVAATMHDTEGLNTMVYNRCIGTRYCSNNCPYKVRRFNYFDWHAKPPRDSTGVMWPGMPDTQQREQVDPFLRLQFNPDVTVRMRGVMEKCTYCTQRLQRAKIAKRNAAIAAGKVDEFQVMDGEVVTACQQACPTQAIMFGNLWDKKSRVVALQRNARAYDVLGDLNTRPRTKFLAKLRNPGDAGSGAGGAGKEHHTGVSPADAAAAEVVG
jgi:molybdopterin-containing oxidoreductase family iron-sulfur binding subunit